jgi:fructose PTS system EIIBC or EIIC component
MNLKKFGQDLKKHFLTGVSYMIPLVIAGAVIMGVARIGATFYGIQNIWDASHASSASALVRLFHTLDGLGGIGLGLMLPVIACGISYSISDKLGIAPGLIAGQLAANLNTGFLGALVAGLLAGYVCLFLSKKVKVPEVASSVVPIFIVPVFGTLITVLIMKYIIGSPLTAINLGLQYWIMSMTTVNAIVLAAIMGAMVGFDLGGPVNKAAVTTAMALIASGIYLPNTAVQVAIIVPPLGAGVATLLSKKKYDSSLREAGKAALIMGFVGISEGAIPFAIESPLKVIPVNMIGSAVASAMAVGLGAVNKAPISGFYGWFVVEKWPVYVLSIAVGAGIIGVLLSLSRKNMPDVEEINESVNEEKSVAGGWV